MSVAVNLSRASQLSSHIHNMCSEAREAVYTREADVKHWLDKGERRPGFCRRLGGSAGRGGARVKVALSQPPSVLSVQANQIATSVKTAQRADEG